jgi:pimeloyl-ACP methyl ester carboxylesterase
VDDDADEEELLRRQPTARIVRFEESGHSIQGDQPVELARLIDELIGS